MARLGELARGILNAVLAEMADAESERRIDSRSIDGFETATTVISSGTPAGFAGRVSHVSQHGFESIARARRQSSGDCRSVASDREDWR